MEDRLRIWKARVRPPTPSAMSDRFRQEIHHRLASASDGKRTRHSTHLRRFDRVGVRTLVALLAVIGMLALVPSLSMPAATLALFQPAMPSMTPAHQSMAVINSMALPLNPGAKVDSGWMTYRGRIYAISDRLVAAGPKTLADLESARLTTVRGVSPTQSIAVVYASKAPHLAQFIYPERLRFRGQVYTVLRLGQTAHPGRRLGQVHGVLIYASAGLSATRAIVLVSGALAPAVAAQAALPRKR